MAALLRYRLGTESKVSGFAGTIVLLYLIALIFFLEANYNQSLFYLFDAYASACIAGAAMLLSVPFLIAKFQSKHKLSAIISLASMGFLLIYFGGITLWEDYDTPRREVEGVVTRLYQEHCGKCAPVLHADINQRRTNVTRQVFASLKVGEYVKAHVGRGSNYIYAVEPTSPTLSLGHSEDHSILNSRTCDDLEARRQMAAIVGFDSCKQSLDSSYLSTRHQ